MPYVAKRPLTLHYELYPMAQNEFAGRVAPPESGLMREMLEESLMGGQHIAGSKYDGAKTDSGEPGG